MTWKEYKESLKLGAPTPNMLRALLVLVILSWPTRWVARKIVSLLGLTEDSFYGMAYIFFNTLLVTATVIVLLRIFPPYRNKRPPAAPGGEGG